MRGVSYAMDTVVEWHMGTQWGIVTRILMTRGVPARDRVGDQRRW